MPWMKRPTAFKKPDLVAILPKTPALEKAMPTMAPKPSQSISAGLTHRKVLIVEDEPSIRNVLYVLLAGLGFDGDVAHSGRQALSMITRESFDAVLLDLRCSDMAAEQVVAKIREVQPSLVGRVLVITGEVTDPPTLEFIERYTLPSVPRHRVLQDIGQCLRAVLGVARE